MGIAEDEKILSDFSDIYNKYIDIFVDDNSTEYVSEYLLQLTKEHLDSISKDMIHIIMIHNLIKRYKLYYIDSVLAKLSKSYILNYKSIILIGRFAQSYNESEYKYNLINGLELLEIILDKQYEFDINDILCKFICKLKHMTRDTSIILEYDIDEFKNFLSNFIVIFKKIWASRFIKYKPDRIIDYDMNICINSTILYIKDFCGELTSILQSPRIGIVPMKWNNKKILLIGHRKINKDNSKSILSKLPIDILKIIINECQKNVEITN